MPGLRLYAHSPAVIGLFASLGIFFHPTDLAAAGRDNAPPKVSITAPADGASLSGIVAVTASASDNVAVASVQFKLDNVNLGAAVTSAPYSIGWTTASAANGSHTLTAVAQDTRGNTRTSAAVRVTVTSGASDITPPTISITAPAGGATVSGTVNVSANAADNVGVVGVQFELDGTNLGTEVTSAPYAGAWNTTTTNDGSHTLTAVARDAAGNRKTSAGVTVTVANNALPPPPGGIASHYPGDVGIENDPAAVFVEHFNESTLTALFNQWGDVLNGSAMSLVSDAPAGSPYPHSLNIPWVGGGVNDGGHLYKVLSPGVDDTLYVRYYVKYPTNGTPHHSGIQVGGYNPPSAWPDPHAGEKPAGNDRFLAGAEQLYNLGSFDHYDYWMGMHADSGGTYWGDFLLNNPKVQATRGQWMCVEEMV